MIYPLNWVGAFIPTFLYQMCTDAIILIVEIILVKGIFLNSKSRETHLWLYIIYHCSLRMMFHEIRPCLLRCKRMGAKGRRRGETKVISIAESDFQVPTKMVKGIGAKYRTLHMEEERKLMQLWRVYICRWDLVNGNVGYSGLVNDEAWTYRGQACWKGKEQPPILLMQIHLGKNLSICRCCCC